METVRRMARWRGRSGGNARGGHLPVLMGYKCCELLIASHFSGLCDNAEVKCANELAVQPVVGNENISNMRRYIAPGLAWPGLDWTRRGVLLPFGQLLQDDTLVVIYCATMRVK